MKTPIHVSWIFKKIGEKGARENLMEAKRVKKYT